MSLAFAGSMSNDDGASQYDSDEDSGVSAESTEQNTENVHAICSLLEDKGLTVKRVGDPLEAIERARELQANKQLRCVIYGAVRRDLAADGDVMEHPGEICYKCGKPWGVLTMCTLVVVVAELIKPSRYKGSKEPSRSLGMDSGEFSDLLDDTNAFAKERSFTCG